MATHKLTDGFIKRIRSSEQTQRYSDGQGLVLWVTPQGSKLWRYRYRYQGTPKMLSLGVYPEISLAQARVELLRLRTILHNGEDPSLIRRQQQRQIQAAQEHCFSQMAHAWHKIWSSRVTPAHADKIWRRLEKDILPDIGRLPVTSITPQHLKDLLRKIEERGSLSMLSRILSVCSQVFDYAIAESIIELNPAKSIHLQLGFTHHREQHFSKVSVEELPQLLYKIAHYDSQHAGDTLTRIALQLLAYTFVRTSELIGAQWQEIEWDKKLWRIPADRMKMGREHLVPLSAQALSLFQEAKALARNLPQVFPNQQHPSRCMSNNTMLYALYHLGYHSRMTGHGFRSLASTLLHEQGYEHAQIEAQLAHQERNKVSAAYNHAIYLPQRQKLMQAWADYLDRLRDVGRA